MREGDIILGIDSMKMEMTAQAFLGYVRQNYLIGDRIVLIRDGRLTPVARVPVRRVAERGAPLALAVTSDTRESSAPGIGHVLPACTLGP